MKTNTGTKPPNTGGITTIKKPATQKSGLLPTAKTPTTMLTAAGITQTTG